MPEFNSLWVSPQEVSCTHDVEGGGDEGGRTGDASDSPRGEYTWSPISLFVVCARAKEEACWPCFFCVKENGSIGKSNPCVVSLNWKA